MGFWVFLREFARNPGQIGSVAPSGVQLSKRMVSAAGIEPQHAVVEIGAGTGPITRQILAAAPGVALMALEPAPDLAAVLRREFPEVRVEERFAQDLPEIVHAWGHDQIDRIVSGLPWTMWSEEVCAAGLGAVTQVLGPEGRMVTFSYVHSQALMPGARRFRRQLREHFETVEQTEVQWRNVPPALVFVCDRPVA